MHARLYVHCVCDRNRRNPTDTLKWRICFCFPCDPSVSTSPASSRGNASYTSMYDKTFPIHTGSPSYGSPRRVVRDRPRCTAQEVRGHGMALRHCHVHTAAFSKIVCLDWLSGESWPECATACLQSVREEEKEVYRQLLAMVSGGQSSLFQNGSSHSGLRSHRDLWVNLSLCPHTMVLFASALLCLHLKQQHHVFLSVICKLVYFAHKIQNVFHVLWHAFLSRCWCVCPCLCVSLCVCGF